MVPYFFQVVGNRMYCFQENDYCFQDWQEGRLASSQNPLVCGCLWWPSTGNSGSVEVCHCHDALHPTGPAHFCREGSAHVLRTTGKTVETSLKAKLFTGEIMRKTESVRYPSGVLGLSSFVFSLFRHIFVWKKKSIWWSQPLRLKRVWLSCCRLS